MPRAIPPSSKPSDEAGPVSRTKDGCLAAGPGIEADYPGFAEVYERGWPIAWSAARPLLACDADADGVAQRVFVRLLDAGAGSWMRDLRDGFFRAAGRNEALTHLRDTSRHVPVDGTLLESIPARGPLPDEITARSELRRRLERAIAALPPRCREVVSAIFAEELTRPEAAERLGISLKGVERQITLGYEHLRSVLPTR
jgi:RNA polymerase sigma factor (sigma-70 family)